jgi:hypothetical protein
MIHLDILKIYKIKNKYHNIKNRTTTHFLISYYTFNVLHNTYLTVPCSGPLTLTWSRVHQTPPLQWLALQLSIARTHHHCRRNRSADVFDCLRWARLHVGTCPTWRPELCQHRSRCISTPPQYPLVSDQRTAT